MEKLWVVYELGAFQFWGTEAECIDYVSRNHFKDCFFTIKEA